MLLIHAVTVSDIIMLLMQINGAKENNGLCFVVCKKSTRNCCSCQILQTVIPNTVFGIFISSFVGLSQIVMISFGGCTSQLYWRFNIRVFDKYDVSALVATLCHEHYNKARWASDQIALHNSSRWETVVYLSTVGCTSSLYVWSAFLSAVDYWLPSVIWVLPNLTFSSVPVGHLYTAPAFPIKIQEFLWAGTALSHLR